LFLAVERREKYSQRQKQNRRDHGITKFSEQKKMGGHCSSITLHIMQQLHAYVSPKKLVFPNGTKCEITIFQL
jgi:hypothetical protein